MRFDLCGLALVVLLLPTTVAGEDDLRREAAQALRRSVDFYTKQVAVHGGYGYRASADLTRREGEGKIGLDTVWVQPPGTPAVGLAYVEAWQRTREPSLLAAARAAGECLLKGQLRSGGWTDKIEFAPAARAKFDYRVDPPGGKRRFNWTTFDDDKTQSALRFLMRLDQALEFRDAAIHEAVEYALAAILKAQSPGGGWPQGFQQPAAADLPAAQRASYPAEWPRQHPGGDYWVWYTFNDNSAADTIEMLLLAADIYKQPSYREAAIRGGEFILLAQMPAPQPAWAQQYNFEMQPVWARKFEPPARRRGRMAIQAGIWGVSPAAELRRASLAGWAPDIPRPSPSDRKRRTPRYTQRPSLRAPTSTLREASVDMSGGANCWLQGMEESAVPEVRSPCCAKPRYWRVALSLLSQSCVDVTFIRLVQRLAVMGLARVMTKIPAMLALEPAQPEQALQSARPACPTTRMHGTGVTTRTV